jgi:abequosyltransferase
MPSNILSIAIPTYNRSKFLDATLEYHIPILSKYDIPIIIRDNNSTDNTEEIIKNWMKIYDYIDYKKNETNIGADKNFELALLDSDTKYVWLLGDSYKINKESIDLIYKKSITSEIDYFIFNLDNRVIGIPSKTYSNSNQVLYDLGWHMTCMASLVYSRRSLIASKFRRYYDTNFLQLGIILEYIALNEFNLLWESNLSVSPLKIRGVQKNSWQARTLDVWVYCWTNFIFSLPAIYQLDIKLKVIKEHNDKANLFLFRKIIKLRLMNFLNLGILSKYSKFFNASLSKRTIFYMYLLSFSPKLIFKVFYYLYRKFYLR